MKNCLSKLIVLSGVVGLCSCSTPGSASNDPFRNAQGFGMSGQMAAHQQASMSYSNRRMGGSLPQMQTVPAFPAFQPFAR